ncbi:MAG: FapA family protein [Spirochaetota bacterium]|nr:MAG: FapA family protein [Spirochaetota bacterium]
MASSFQRLQQALSELTFEAETDKQVENSLNLESFSIEEGLEKASEYFGVSISDLEYEILEHGKKSLFGKKPYKLLIRTVGVETVPEEETGVEGEKGETVVLKKDMDGIFKVRITRVGAVLKVTKPRGKGSKVRVEDVLRALSTKGVADFDKSKIAKIVRDGSGEYSKICDYNPVERNNATVVIEVSEDEMKAFMTIVPPNPGGRDLDIDDVMEELDVKGVTVGIMKEVIAENIEGDVFNVPVLIAEGIKPENGEDAKVVYNFRTEKKLQLEEDEKGQVNFKDLNLVENVVAGQLLATKVQATEGKPGRTVTDRLMDAKDGKDFTLEPGKNTELSQDGMNIMASINGQVMIVNQKVTVEPIYEVNGDVDIHTGNILFLGTVIVKGNVEDGFSIKAAGDIEVRGSVGKCLLDAEGNVNIKQGVMGKLEGTIKAGGAVWAKFLEQVNVISDKSVFVQDGIMHCKVDAAEKVICFGKRATRVGGMIRAGEIVNTKTLGSVSFTETVVEVGVDPKSRQRLFELEKEKSESDASLERLVANINTLENQKKHRRGFTDEKEELLAKMLSSKEEFTIRLSEIKEEMNELKSYLKLLRTIGKVSVSKEVFPGVRIGIKDIYYDVSNEFKNITFVLESGRIRVKKYEEIDLEEIVGRKVR